MSKPPEKPVKSPVFLLNPRKPFQKPKFWNGLNFLPPAPRRSFFTAPPGGVSLFL
jgi:hypothetical protein